MKFIILLVTFPLACWAVAPEENRLATGQGIAAPNVGTLVNLSRGFTVENPAGVMYQDGFRASAQMAKNLDTDTGVEGGYSGKEYGFAAGMFKPGCSGCKPTTAGILGMNFAKSAALGLRYQTSNNIPTYSAGVLFNPSGTHRFGVNVDYMLPPSPAYSTTSVGAGYAYVSKSWTIALEASKQQFQDPTATTGKIVTASLGVQKRVDSLMASLAYESRMNDTNKPTDLMWIGAGFDSTDWNLAFYVNYRQEMMAVLSGYL
jgi:hypothetical protein